MEESVFYIAQGAPGDKHSQESFAVATSATSSQQHAMFRNADCPVNGAVLTGTGKGERLIAASKGKSLLTAWSWGKEASDQKLPVPEEMVCLASCDQPSHASPQGHALPSFRVPWLLAAGSKSGKLYIWEFSSGNLLCVKDAHYQSMTSVEFSKCGTFLVTAGLDARCMVWRVTDLISAYASSDSEERNIKPYFSITDNTLPVTSAKLTSSGIINDLRLVTGSRDGTVRVYDVITRTLLTTFVLSYPVECVALDPANRAIYAGISNGIIRTIPLYKINPITSALESVGGNSKIVTLDNDPELKTSFVHHQQRLSGGSKVLGSSQKSTVDSTAEVSVTQIKVSFDGTSIISGDSVGRVFVANVVTRQVIKALTPCNSAISYIEVNTAPAESLNTSLSSSSKNDKKHRLLPQLKRVLVSSQPLDHQLYMEIPSSLGDHDMEFDQWLGQKANEELEFSNLSTINTSVTTVDSTALQDKFDKVSQAYTELREKHEQLLQEHAKYIQ